MQQIRFLFIIWVLLNTVFMNHLSQKTFPSFQMMVITFPLGAMTVFLRSFLVWQFVYSTAFRVAGVLQMNSQLLRYFVFSLRSPLHFCYPNQRLWSIEAICFLTLLSNAFQTVNVLMWSHWMALLCINSFIVLCFTFRSFICVSVRRFFYVFIIPGVFIIFICGNT